MLPAEKEKRKGEKYGDFLPFVIPCRQRISSLGCEWGRNASAEVDEGGGLIGIHGNNLGLIEQTAEDGGFTHALAGNGNDVHDDGFVLIMPMAISSAMRPEIVVAGVSPGMAIISRPTEHTLVMDSSFSMVSAPQLAAASMLESSDTGMNAPESPST